MSKKALVAAIIGGRLHLWWGFIIFPGREYSLIEAITVYGGRFAAGWAYGLATYWVLGYALQKVSCWWRGRGE